MLVKLRSSKKKVAKQAQAQCKLKLNIITVHSIETTHIHIIYPTSTMEIKQNARSKPKITRKTAATRTKTTLISTKKQF